MSLDPPISTYTTIDNYPTPEVLNRVYSNLDHAYKKEDGSSSSSAWAAQNDCSLEREFNNTKLYKLIYQKFAEDRSTIVLIQQSQLQVL